MLISKNRCMYADCSATLLPATFPAKSFCRIYSQGKLLGPSLIFEKSIKKQSHGAEHVDCSSYIAENASTAILAVSEVFAHSEVASRSVYMCSHC